MERGGCAGIMKASPGLCFRAPCGALSPGRRLFMGEDKVTVFARIGG